MKFFHNQSTKFLGILLVITLIILLYLIKDYLVTLILAGVFTGMLTPVYKKVLGWTKNRKNLSAALVTIVFLLIIVIPAFFILVQIFSQGEQLGSQLVDLVQKELENPDAGNFSSLPDWFPLRDQLAPYTDQIYKEAGQLAGKISGSLLNALGNITQATAVFVVNLFIMLYAIFFFLSNGKTIVKKFSRFIPLSENQFEQLRTELLSTSRATIRGAGLIGIIQGLLVGLSFWYVGIQGAFFWAAVAALASLIPSVGCALVYIPGAIYLYSTGDTHGAIIVLAWGLLVVGSVDNFLRPVLVGQDTQISELMILISTLGGISMFGLSGVILGPMIASFFVTIARQYRQEFA